MTAQLGIILALLAAAAIAVAEAWRQRGLRRGLGVIAGLAAPLLLYFLLYPPARPGAGTELVLLTPGVTATQIAALPVTTQRIALPGSTAGTDIEQAPDLATALRRYPQTGALRLLGLGLAAADRDSARGWPLRFDAAEAAAGFSDVQLPADIRAGHSFVLRGRVQAAAGMQLALRQPGVAEPLRSDIATDGDFHFDLLARQAGTVDYELQLLATDGGVVDRLAVPVQVRRGNALRLLLLSGGPDADLKYLQRWALDAGHQVAARTWLSRGIAQQRGDADLTAAALAQTDLVIVDERAWIQLDKPARTRLLEAASQGLGLLLRLSGPLPPALAAEWRALGLDLRNGDFDTKLQLPGAGGDTAALRRLPLQAAPGALQVLATATDGRALGVAGNHGLGRIGAWWLQGSSALVTSGQSALHDVLWARLVDTLARPRLAQPPALPQILWRGERSLLCSTAATASVAAPDGSLTPLVMRRLDAETFCAGFWPREAGWHELRAGDSRQAFAVRAATDAPGLHRAQTLAATRALAGPGDETARTATATGPRWPWFLAWLASASLLWWLQRRRETPA